MGFLVRERLSSASRAHEKNFDCLSTKLFRTFPPFIRQFVDCLKQHVPSLKTPGGPPLWVVVHVMVKCIEGLYDLLRVWDVYNLTQVDRHTALTTNWSTMWGDSRWSPTRWVHWWPGTLYFFCGEAETYFLILLHPHEMQAWALQDQGEKIFSGLVVGRW